MFLDTRTLVLLSITVAYGLGVMSILLTFFQAGTRGMRHWGVGLIGLGTAFLLLTLYPRLGLPALYAGWTCHLVSLLVMYQALLRICGGDQDRTRFGLLVIGGAVLAWVTFGYFFPNPDRLMDATAIAIGIIGGRAAWDLWRYSRRVRYPAPAMAVAFWLSLIAVRPILEFLTREFLLVEPDFSTLFGPPGMVFLRALVLSLLSMSVLWLEVSRLYETVELQATQDELTGIANRRGIVALLQRELARAKRHQSYCSVVIFDIDNFKQVNDSRGHPVGDQVLRCVAQVLTRSIRPYDTLGRYGGEEFLLVIPGAMLEEARAIADRAREAVESHVLTVDGKSLPLTISAGVAAWDPGIDDETLLRIADDALYRAKEGGRNRVEVAEPVATT